MQWYTDWTEEFEKLGAFYRHDGIDLSKPFVRTRSGISDFYFNADIVEEDPRVLSKAVGHLLGLPAFLRAMAHTPGALERTPRAQPPQTTMSPAPQAYVEDGQCFHVRVIAPAYGGILFSYEIGRHLGCKIAYTAKRADGTVGLRDGFVHRLDPEVPILLVDDTITSGNTVRDTRDDVLRHVPHARFVPCVLALCNRSGSDELDGMQIASLISPRCRVWQDGRNPFTGGAERVSPVVKPKEHWRELVG